MTTTKHSNTPTVVVGHRTADLYEPSVTVKRRPTQDGPDELLVYADDRRNDGRFGHVSANHPHLERELALMIHHYLTLPVVNP